LPLTVTADTGEVLNTTVNLSPDSSTSVKATVRFPAAGSHVLTASVRSAGFVADDRLETVVDAVDPVRVLVISGDERPSADASAGTFRGESDFLRLALSPHGAAPTSPAASDSATATVVPAEQWSGPSVALAPSGAAAPAGGTGAELDTFQVVVLANVERFTPVQARALEQFVYAGGGLLVAPGNLSRVDDYNESLYRGGAGILPAELLPPTAGDGSEATSILGFEPGHPVFRFLRGRPDPIPSATIGRYFPARPRAPDGRRLSSYVSGWPFLVEAPTGRGRVLLMTTPLDADWSTLPLSNFYLPFVQSAVRYLAGGTLPDRNLLPGQPIRVTFEDGEHVAGAPARSVTLTRPGSDEAIALEVRQLGRQSEVRYADTDRPGEYRLLIKEAAGQRTLHFVVRAPSDESDLTQLAADRWDSLEDALAARRIETTQRPVESVLQSASGVRELWSTAIGAVLALAVVEMLLARAATRDASGDA
jgi:hypothetical protein